MRSSCAEASPPPIVRRYIRGDLPTSVWWTEDLSQVPPLPSLVTMGRQLVYDSRRWQDVAGAVRALASLVGNDRVDLADTNWRRLAPLRRALEHAGGTAGGPFLTAGARVHIAHHRDDAALAWLLAGAVMASPDRVRPQPPEVEESAAIGDSALVVTVEQASTRATITLSATGATVVGGTAGAPLAVTMPIESEADAVAAELRLLSQDRALHAALAALVQRFVAR